MLFYVTAAALTILLLGIVFWPALRRDAPVASTVERDFDVAIYKDQLSELEADLERGTIDATQAQYARAEIGRRLLAAGEAAGAQEAEAAARRRSGAPVLIAAAIFVPVAAVLVYSVIGSPGMKAEPLAARVDEMQREQASTDLRQLGAEELVRRAEAHLEANPEDGRGWDVLAPMYLRLGRPGDARTAFERAIALLGETPARRSGLGEAYYMLAGSVDAHARAEFERALALDATESRALFFLALAKAEAGDEEGARTGWQALANNDASAAEWRAAAEEGLRRLAGTNVASAPGSTAPKLDQETLNNAQSMSAGDRQAMIEGMIAQLDQRLRDNPDDMAGWQRLIRSYSVLGKKTEAEDALKRAMDAFAGDETKHAQVVEFAAALGIGAAGPASGGTTQ